VYRYCRKVEKKTDTAPTNRPLSPPPITHLSPFQQQLLSLSVVNFDFEAM
jgi:hypothetical protein